jgi:hypothetical protein
MPYALRKAPRQDKYWVVTKATGKHHSMMPLPKADAEAQMRAIYASEGREMQGGARSTVAAISGALMSPTNTMNEFKEFFVDIAGIWNGGNVAEGLRTHGKKAFSTLIKYLPLAGAPGFAAASALEKLKIDAIINLLATLIDLITGKASLEQLFNALKEFIGNIFDMLKDLALAIFPAIGEAIKGGLQGLVDTINGPAKHAQELKLTAERQKLVDEEKRVRDLRVSAEAADLAAIDSAMTKLLTAKLVTVGGVQYLPFPVQPTRAENTLPSSGNSKYGAWDPRKDTSLLSNVILLSVGPSDEDIPPLSATTADELRTLQSQKLQTRTSIVQWERMGPEERQAAVKARAEWDAMDEGEQQVALDDGMVEPPAMPEGATDAPESSGQKASEPAGYDPLGLRLLDAENDPNGKNVPSSTNGWLFNRQKYDEFVSKLRPNVKVISADDLAALEDDAQYRFENGGKSRQDVKNEASQAYYNKYNDVKPPQGEAELASFSSWLQSQGIPDNTLNYSWENYKGWRESLGPTAVAQPAPEPVSTALSPAEQATFTTWLQEHPEYDGYGNDYAVSVFKSLEGSGKLLGGSMLIEHAVRHHPHKRMRENYDPRFFM